MTRDTGWVKRFVARKFRAAVHKLKVSIGFYRLKFPLAKRFKNPTPLEFKNIEADLRAENINLTVLDLNQEEFHEFCRREWFPADYHGGRRGKVWTEKLFEHWISFKLLGLEEYLDTDLLVDVAASSSPWARILRERLGVRAFANDLLEVPEQFQELEYYVQEDATKSRFDDGTVSGMSLHCAFEMFVGNADQDLIVEASRILKPGGKLVVVPLYMHTHPCAYATPEYFNKGFQDAGSVLYLRTDIKGVASSRKYDVSSLLSRVLDTASECGLTHKVYVIHDSSVFGEGIYCKFVLELEKP